MKRILIVEDEEIVSSVLSDILRKEGFESIVATRGNEAWEMTHTFVPDLILLDILIPELNGWDLLTKYRKHLGCFCSKVKIVVLSNVSWTADDREKAISMGAEDFWLKVNFTPKHLAEKIKELFK